MPNLIVTDWKEVKISDFPKFKCLCELCDCGCFERTSRSHTSECKKKETGMRAYFNKNAPTEKSLYNESYKKEILECKMRPIVYGEPPINIEIGDKRKKLPKSTQNDDFKFWEEAEITKPIHEPPEITSGLMYPNNQRRHITTNEQLFPKNHGNFKAKPSGANMFENSFKMDQNNYTVDTKSNGNSVYGNDFIITSKNRDEIITKTKFENGKNHTSGGKIRIPMVTKTNNMDNFLEFDADLYRNIIQSKNKLNANCFESSLSNGCKPLEKNNGSPSIFTSRSNDPVKNTEISDSGNLNIRYISTLDNKQIPCFKMSNSNSESIKLEDNSNKTESTYHVDFKKNGVDVCMSKAYRRAENNIF